MDEYVLPPPVGTVREKRPGEFSALALQSVRTDWRRELTGDGSASRAICVSFLCRAFCRVAKSEYWLRERRVDFSGSQKASVSKKSASVRQEKTMRVKSAKEKPGFWGIFENGYFKLTG